MRLFSAATLAYVGGFVVFFVLPILGAFLEGLL